MRGVGAEVRLYHYTSRRHLPLILRDGFLRPTESNVSANREHAGPDVVWLLDRPLADAPGSHGLNGASVDKTEVRFTVDLPPRVATRWLDWRHQKGMDPMWRATIIRTGGGLAAAKRWYVVPRAIPREEWADVSIGGLSIDPTANVEALANLAADLTTIHRSH
jgi:hypothetical protein